MAMRTSCPTQRMLLRGCSRPRARVSPACAAHRNMTRRQLAGSLLVTAPLVLSGAAQARDAEAAKAAAEERKRKLREAADADRSSGEDKQVFSDSDYMVGEDARTPNVHSRQGEGARTQVNA